MARPNVLLIMLDQMRWDAVAAHGNPVIRTPNIDALVTGGVSFERAYTHSPVCVPARATVLSGQLPHNNGVFSNATPLRDGVPAQTFPRLLAAAGYATQAIGKMHFTPPRAPHGIDDLLLSEEIPDRLDEDDFLTDLLRAGYGHVEEPHGVRHELYYSPQPSQLPEDQHTTAWTGRRTCEFLEHRAGRTDEPFFCWTSFIKPHPPFDPPAPWYRMYDPLDMPDPVREPAELSRLTYHQRLQHRGKWTTTDLDPGRLRTMKAYYYASVSFVDAWIGEMMAALDRLGMRERTLVVLTSDHGEYLGDHWSFGKRGFHDAAARVPLILNQPGTLPAGHRSDALVGLADLAPTFLDVAGVTGTPDVDGMSLVPLAAPVAAPERDHLFGQLDQGRTGVYLSMDREYKYVFSAPDDREFLFRYDTPGAETRDLAAESSSAGVLAGLREALIGRFLADGYQEPLDGGRWRRYGRVEFSGTDDDREDAGRGRQYAAWPRSEPWAWSGMAADTVGQMTSDSGDSYSGA